jgi:hypothetical protein
MKKFFGMVITCMMALGLVSCSAADDDLTGDTTTCVNTVTTKSNFSLLSYSQTIGAEVNETSNINGENNEKLVCKVLSGGQLQMTHKNVIFDEGTNIKFDSQLVGNKIIITETGDYGKSGKYGYFTLVAKVGIVKDGDYVIVVKRNDHTREEFNMHYDSSKAK